MATDMADHKEEPSMVQFSEEPPTIADNREEPHIAHPSEKTPTIADRPPFSRLHELAFVALICSAQVLTLAALGQSVAPLHIIGAHFHVTNPGQLSWYVAGYSLTVGTFILIAGRLGDMYGHKKMFIGGYLWFGLWSLVAGFSYYCSSQIFFIMCRVIQGIGPAFLLPNALAILGTTYSEPSMMKRKNITFSLFGGMAPMGFLLGAVFSSIYAQFVFWPWAYWTLAIVCFALSAASFAIIPSKNKIEPYLGRTESFDFLGSFAGVACLVLFNIAWNQGPSIGWGSAYVIACLILGLLIFVLFLYIESQVQHPILPLVLLTRPTCFVLACIAAGWSSFGIWLFYSWQFLEDLRHVSPLLSAAQIAPAAIFGIVASGVTAFLMSHHIAPTAVMALSMIFFLIPAILAATMPVNQTYWAQFFVAVVIAPFGMDMSFPAGTLILSASVPREHQGMAASLITTVVNYSISIGLGIAGTVEVNVNKSGADLLHGYRGAFYVGIGLSGLGVVIATMGFLRYLWQQRELKRTLSSGSASNTLHELTTPEG